MNIESLMMFCYVVEEGSISQAARKGFVSQPAATKQIRQLEDQYGSLLFDRTDNKLVVTEAGTTLYPYAKEIVTYYKRSQEAVKSVAGTVETNLHVGASFTIGEYILPELLGKFVKRYDNAKFNLSLGNTPELLAKLKNNEIDIALVEGILENDKKDQELTVEKFAEDELILITPYVHRWKDKDEIEIEELTEDKMIWRESLSGTRMNVEDILKERGVFHQIEGTMELGSIQSIKSAVEAGLGISIVPKLTVRKELKFEVLREVKIKDFHLARDLYMVQKKTRFRKIGLTNFAEFIRG